MSPNVHQNNSRGKVSVSDIDTPKSGFKTDRQRFLYLRRGLTNSFKLSVVSVDLVGPFVSPDQG